MAEGDLNQVLRDRLAGASGQEKKEEEEDVTLGSVKRMLKEQLEIKTLKSLVSEPPVPQQVLNPAINIPPQDSPFRITGQFNISDIVNSQTAAREQAEMARDNVQRAFWDSIVKRYEDLFKYTVEANKPKDNGRPPDPFEQYRTIKAMMDEIKKDLQPAGIPGLPSSGNIDHTVFIELKKMDFDHQARLHELSELSKDRDRQFKLELMKMDRQDAAMSRLSNLGGSIANGIAEAMNEAPVSVNQSPSTMSQVPAESTQIGKLTSFKCKIEECGQTVPIVEGQDKQICPGCHAEYEVT